MADGTRFIRRALAQTLDAVTDITVTQRVTSRTQEPYIYVNNTGNTEAYVTKEDVPREYPFRVEVVYKYRGNLGGPTPTDEVADLVVRTLRTTSNYPDVTDDGFDIFIITTGSISRRVVENRGATYFIATIPVIVTAAQDVIITLLENWCTASGETVQTQGGEVICFSVEQDNN